MQKVYQDPCHRARQRGQTACTRDTTKVQTARLPGHTYDCTTDHVQKNFSRYDHETIALLHIITYLCLYQVITGGHKNDI